MNALIAQAAEPGHSWSLCCANRKTNLPGVGTQSVVSEILSGKRQLNVRQIRWLADHFKVPVDMFL